MARLRIRKDRAGRPAYHVLDWSDSSGRHQITLGRVGVLTPKQLNDILRAKQLELSTGAQLLNLPRHVTTPLFEDWVREAYLPWHASEYPDSHYRIRQILEQHLIPRFGPRRMSEIESELAEQMKQDRRADGAKAHTISKELRALQAVLNRAVLLKVIEENPITAVRAPRILDAKPHHFYEPEQLQALYLACGRTVNAGRGPQPDPAHAAIWKLYVNTGMRRGEGMQLRRQWIGRDEIKIVSTGEERTKSGQWRAVPKTDGAAEALDRLKGLGCGEYVLPRYDLRSLSRFFAHDARAAGIGGSLHTLRHTYISLMMRDTQTPVRTIQLWAGHAHITTTEGYLYLREHRVSPVRGLNL